MSRHIRTTVSNTHPVKVNPPHSYAPGQPMHCHAQVLAVIGMDRDKVAISMNGTAVFTKDEFREWVNAVLGEDLI